MANWVFSNKLKYEIDTRGTLKKLAKNKAERIDKVSGEWIIINDENNETDIRSSYRFGPCDEDPGSPVPFTGFSFIYCPIASQSPKNTP